MTSAWAPWHTRSPTYQRLREAGHSLEISHDSWLDLDEHNRLLQSAPTPILSLHKLDVRG